MPFVLVSCVVAFLVLESPAISQPAKVPPVLFYAAFEVGMEPDQSAGRPEPYYPQTMDVLLRRPARPTAPGVVGRGVSVRAVPLAYLAEGNVDPEEGTVSLWVRPEWAGSDTSAYRVLFCLPNWGMLYKYTTQTHLTFGMLRPDGSWHYGCTADIAPWQPGQWRHVGITWSRAGNYRRLYLDGERRAEAPFVGVYRRPTLLFLGAGTDGANPLRGLLDEVIILGGPAPDEVIRRFFDLGREGRHALPLVPAAAAKSPSMPPPPGAPPPWVDWSTPRRPAPPGGGSAVLLDNGWRGALCLNGVWCYRPDSADGPWLYRRVPSLGPNFQVFTAEGSPARVPDAAAAWFHRQFTLP
ncbi:MAG: LamG domain-containing protein, partial [Armatimonadota bacterium]|nr:LamG domain-containing protein [Armatimonadota bacterium]